MDIRLLTRRDHRVGIRETERDRLLHEHVLPSGRRGNRL
jgi:hypothetical protein